MAGVWPHKLADLPGVESALRSDAPRQTGEPRLIGLKQRHFGGLG